MITPLGDFRICALTNSLEMNEGMALDERGQLMNIMTHTPNQGLNGKWHRAVRIKDVTENGAFHPLCSCCSEREAATGGDKRHPSASRRQSMERRNPFNDIVGPDTYNQVEMDEKAYYMGDEAKERRGRLEMKRPIFDSLVKNWDDIESLWTHTFFNVLKVCPDEIYAVVTESPMNPIKYRGKSIEILLELFNLEGVYLASKSLLSLYARWCCDGLGVGAIS